MQLAAGYWLVVPLSVIHLAFAILGFIYFDQEWAVFAEIVAVFTIDPTCAIEGLAFDAFGSSESQARQASSTVLSVFTICFAASCAFGGIAFDFYGWKGTAAYHTICQSLLLFMLTIQPAMRKSFMQVWFPSKKPEKIEKLEEDQVESSARAPKTDASGANGTFLPVLPGAVEEHNPPDAAGDLVVEEVGQHVEADALGPKPPRATEQSFRGSRIVESRGIRHSEISSYSRVTRMTINTAITGRSSNTHGTARTGVTAHTARTAHTAQTARTGATGATGGTGRTAMTARSVLSAMSRMTALSEAGDDFRMHMGTTLATMPYIVGPTGETRVVRDAIETIDEEGNLVVEDDTETGGTKGPKIPKDIRLPAFLIVLNCFTNTAVYCIEYSTFAIFFKEVHSWNEATWASLAQTSGDVMAALMMQVIPFLMPGDYDPDAAGPCSRFFHNLTSQPYTISCVLAAWVVFNACMISPWLPLAIVAQVLMGTSFVYSCKWSTEMNLFFSLGDSKVFLALQVLCRNADAIGGGLGGMFGTWLFTLDPALPFVFGTGWATFVFLLYTVSFCARLGFGDDIETAEAKRSARLGKERVSMWEADARKSVAPKDAYDIGE